MKKPLILAASALFVLIGAAYPQGPKLAYADSVASDGDTAPVRYRPCRRGRGDDRCIQLYERGVRLAYARWLRGKDDSEPETRLAQGGPYEPRAGRAARGHAHHDRCPSDRDTAVDAADPVDADPDAGAVRGM